MYEQDYGLAKMAGTVLADSPKVYTLREQLVMKKERAEKNLADINQALKFMDDNPNFEAFHNLIGKTGF